ncbi:class I SAM-dependent methyltransferase [Sphingobium bisphenolivorans]|uniref:class I SAM-dependent methyltransferase n=1 Tax=Sphingobium bisphenolivorans TaxID=1335760 RepID=UPI0003A02F8B|nr:methyltransferase domain-containing protein [Sphingobium bisphenolivorans]
MAVGSAFPASRYMVDAMLAPIDWRRVRTVVEFGPGTGVFTRALLDRLPRDARLLALDTSEGFIGHLRATIPDSRLIAAAGCATEIRRIMSAHGLEQVDCILSGLPFSTVPPEVADRIMDASRRMLNEDGYFLAYQMRSAVHPLLRRHFARVEKGFEWRNIPPCHLYWAHGPWKDAPW